MDKNKGSLTVKFSGKEYLDLSVLSKLCSLEADIIISAAGVKGLITEEEYQEWVTRYECNTKAQEEIFQRLSLKKLEIHKASLQGDSTDKLDATYQQWLTTANITPKQSGRIGLRMLRLLELLSKNLKRQDHYLKWILSLKMWIKLD